MLLWFWTLLAQKFSDFFCKEELKEGQETWAEVLQASDTVCSLVSALQSFLEI